MDQLLTPLLRKVYRWFTAFVLLYLAFFVFERTTWNKERLYRKLMAGDQPAIASAAFDLAYLKGESQLVRALKAPSGAVRTAAINSLWDLWVRAAGHRAFRDLQAANAAVERNAYQEALDILGRVTRTYPDFSEGWNRRATLYWRMGRMKEAVIDARKVVELNPNHFGAWQGMALCLVHIGDLEEACDCLRRALRITPHDAGLRSLLTRCEALLEALSHGHQVPKDLT